ncbi:AAA family ATPase [Spongiactinospora sp. TRM90649]|uniref:AAA family ATPase n=1 Tax=Spongiactinospora sp. TRM90649 TaxID=3031114 RepID=UPI0023F9F9BD|nr:AAA family ATPase [Spongiactinospora sp. TRM90649]MDF5758703.1 AAA family ATPase [Spongiactinospora sp. TRM90649]
MKSAANRPPGLGDPADDETVMPETAGEESIGEQTVSFRPIRDDADDPGEEPEASEPSDESESSESSDEAEVADEPEDPGAEADESGDNAPAEEPADEPEPDADGEPESEPDTAKVKEIALPDAAAQALGQALHALKETIADLRFGADAPGAEEAGKAREEILAQLDNYVMPRVRMSTAPALVVVAGSTGAGKSTLVNSLAGGKVSATGVRRPTTSTPVLVCHPDDREWFAEGGLLGGLTRVERPGPETGPGDLAVATSVPLPPGIALLDSPDIDSVVVAHHEIAHRMLDAADLWIFVTTAARYADAPAWRLLRTAKERGARLAIVLSRVPPRAREVVVKHFVRMLTEYGLGDAERFVINECATSEGRLPENEISELRMWLTELSVDDERREQAVRTALETVLDSFRGRVPALARHLETQVAFRGELRSDVEAAYAGALSEIDEISRNGSLLRGEVLARWQDFTGSGDLMRTLSLRRPGRFASKITRQAPERRMALKSALRAGLEAVVIAAAQRAAERTATRWARRGAHGARLAAAPELGHVSDDLVRRTGRSIAAWQDHLAAMIRKEGVTKRSVGKISSFDEESLGLIFTVGILGYGMPEIDGGPGPMPQRLLRALLGAESLRHMSVKARNDLRARINTLFDEETLRYATALDGAGIPDETAASRLYQVTYNLEAAR